MEILIQSVVQNARRSGSSVHIRYSERKEHPAEESGNGKKVVISGQPGESKRTISYVIIHKPYTYLEPVVRSMFEEAEDVKVIVDRRFRERRSGPASYPITSLRKRQDRRQAVPMLDILINVDS